MIPCSTEKTCLLTSSEPVQKVGFQPMLGAGRRALGVYDCAQRRKGMSLDFVRTGAEDRFSTYVGCLAPGAGRWVSLLEFWVLGVWCIVHWCN